MDVQQMLHLVYHKSLAMISCLGSYVGLIVCNSLQVALNPPLRKWFPSCNKLSIIKPYNLT